MTDLERINEILVACIGKDKAREVDLYTSIRFIREVESLISLKYQEQIFRCPVHLSIGQEAIAVGISSLINVNDKVISTHRSHAHYLAKGGDLFRMFAEILGSTKGCCGGKGGSMHLVDKSVGFFGSIPIVGSSLPISAGLALAEKMEQTGNIVVSFVGDAALETGAFYETLNLTSLKELPLLIVIEDNGYSTYADKSMRISSKRSTRNLIEGFGLYFSHATGDDVYQVISTSKVAIDRARGNQPSVLEFETFRKLEHCGPNNDDALGYRSKKEIESYDIRDPIRLTKSVLDKSVSEATFEKIDKIVEDYVSNIFTVAFSEREREFEDFLQVTVL